MEGTRHSIEPDRSNVNVMRTSRDIQAKVKDDADRGNESACTEARGKDQDPRRQTRARFRVNSQTGTTEAHWFSAEHSETQAWK